MSAVKQADAKSMQSLVEQIKAKSRGGQLRRGFRLEDDATEPETKTDEPAALKSRQRQSLLTKLSNRS